VDYSDLLKQYFKLKSLEVGTEAAQQRFFPSERQKLETELLKLSILEKKKGMQLPTSSNDPTFLGHTTRQVAKSGLEKLQPSMTTIHGNPDSFFTVAKQLKNAVPSWLRITANLRRGRGYATIARGLSAGY
jgi:hypothetical protein